MLLSNSTAIDYANGEFASGGGSLIVWAVIVGGILLAHYVYNVVPKMKREEEKRAKSAQARADGHRVD